MTDTSLPATYYVASRYRASVFTSAIPLGVLFGLLAIGIVVGAVRQTSGSSIGDVTIIIAIILFVIYNVWAMRRRLNQTWLHISAQGMTYHTPGLTIETSWQNVSRVHERDCRAICILDKRSATYMSLLTTFWRWTSSAYWNVERCIPLYMFDWSSSSELRRSVMTLAPQLFVSRPTRRSI